MQNTTCQTVRPALAGRTATANLFPPVGALVFLLGHLCPPEAIVPWLTSCGLMVLSTVKPKFISALVVLPLPFQVFAKTGLGRGPSRRNFFLVTLVLTMFGAGLCNSSLRQGAGPAPPVCLPKNKLPIQPFRLRIIKSFSGSMIAHTSLPQMPVVHLRMTPHLVLAASSEIFVKPETGLRLKCLRPDKSSFDRFLQRNHQVWGHLFLAGSESTLQIAQPGYIQLKDELAAGPAAHVRPKELGVLWALLWADKNEVDGETQGLYRSAGIAHLIVASGFHLGVLVAFVYLLLWPVPLSWRITGGICAGCAFYFFSGAGISFLRAILVLAFFLAALSADRSRTPFRLLALTMMALLIYNPQAAFAPGVHLSFLALTGILTCTSPLEKMLSVYPHLNPSASPWPRQIVNRLATYFRQTLAATIAAQAFTAPYVLLVFGGYAAYAVPANIIAAPLTSIALLAGVSGSGLWLLLSSLSTDLALMGARPFFSLAGWTLSLQHSWLDLLAAAPGFGLELASQGKKEAWAVAFAVSVVWLCLLYLFLRPRLALSRTPIRLGSLGLFWGCILLALAAPLAWELPREPAIKKGPPALGDGEPTPKAKGFFTFKKMAVNVPYWSVCKEPPVPWSVWQGSRRGSVHPRAVRLKATALLTGSEFPPSWPGSAPGQTGPEPANSPNDQGIPKPILEIALPGPPSIFPQAPRYHNSYRNSYRNSYHNSYHNSYYDSSQNRSQNRSPDEVWIVRCEQQKVLARWLKDFDMLLSHHLDHWPENTVHWVVYGLSGLYFERRPTKQTERPSSAPISGL